MRWSTTSPESLPCRSWQHSSRTLPRIRVNLGSKKLSATGGQSEFSPRMVFHHNPVGAENFSRRQPYPCTGRRRESLAGTTIPRSRLSLYSSVGMMALGILTLLFVSILAGMILTAVGLLMYFFYRRLERRSQRLAEASGGFGSTVEEGSSGSAPIIIREKETQVVVRIPCKHCGTLNDQLRTKCESCGGPLN
jgi:hypothetical protein